MLFTTQPWFSTSSRRSWQTVRSVSKQNNPQQIFANGGVIQLLFNVGEVVGEEVGESVGQVIMSRFMSAT